MKNAFCVHFAENILSVANKCVRLSANHLFHWNYFHSILFFLEMDAWELAHILFTSPDESESPEDEYICYCWGKLLLCLTTLERDALFTPNLCQFFGKLLSNPTTQLSREKIRKFWYRHMDLWPSLFPLRWSQFSCLSFHGHIGSTSWYDRSVQEDGWVGAFTELHGWKARLIGDQIFSHISFEIEPDHSFYFNVISDETGKFQEGALECFGTCTVDLSEPEAYVRCFVHSAISHGFGYERKRHKSVTVTWPDEATRIIMVPVSSLGLRKPMFYATHHDRVEEEIENVLRKLNVASAVGAMIVQYAHECSCRVTCALAQWRASTHSLHNYVPTHLSASSLQRYYQLGQQDCEERTPNEEELDTFDEADFYEEYEYRGRLGNS